MSNILTSFNQAKSTHLLQENKHLEFLNMVDQGFDWTQGTVLFDFFSTFEQRRDRGLPVNLAIESFWYSDLGSENENQFLIAKAIAQSGLPLGLEFVFERVCPTPQQLYELLDVTASTLAKQIETFNDRARSDEDGFFERATIEQENAIKAISEPSPIHSLAENIAHFPALHLLDKDEDKKNIEHIALKNELIFSYIKDHEEDVNEVATVTARLILERTQSSSLGDTSPLEAAKTLVHLGMTYNIQGFVNEAIEAFPPLLYGISNHKTLISQACEMNSYSILSTLLQHHAKLSPSSDLMDIRCQFLCSGLFSSVKEGKSLFLEMIYESFDNKVEKAMAGEDAMFLCAGFGSVETLRKLRSMGISYRIKDLDDSTLLHHAAKNGNEKVCTFLTKRELKWETKNINGKSAQSYIKDFHPELVRKLDLACPKVEQAIQSSANVVKFPSPKKSGF